jgi:hypothetical protein
LDGYELSEDEIGELCSRYAEAALVGVLARDYDITERHVRRLTSDVQRRFRDDDSVERAVMIFLAGLELSSRSQVLAESAVALYRNLTGRIPGRREISRARSST